ncbi:MAG TPA: citrate synthase [Polyangiaceae bacterium]|nr:citrate synthase [Polyangiaceae bacterium]
MNSSSSHSRGESSRTMQSYGLDGVIVADTELSDVDGERGRLTVRGYALQQLAGKVSFEALLGLLWDARLPEQQAERELARALGEARVAAHAELWRLTPALALDEPMDALRAGVAALPRAADERAAALQLTACAAVISASWWRLRGRERPIAPDPELSHAEDALRLFGLPHDSSRARALETYWVTVADHGLNASTFAARVVASTDSDTVSAVTAALGALKGRLHGGAPGPVLTLLDSIQSPARARAVLEQLLERGERIMGMGHRVYRVRDPRAEVLERALLELGAGQPSPRLELARAVEKAATELLAERYPERGLRANVEFCTAVLLEALGVPRELFTNVFAAGRTAGWCAHVAEQRRARRILRPAARYVGPPALSGW